MMDRSERGILNGILVALLVFTLTATALVVGVAVAMPAHSAAPTCRPEPPDYPGCTAEQLRPHPLHTFRGEFMGTAEHYRYWRMGVHPRGVIFKTFVTTHPALNRHLRTLYLRAVETYHADALAAGAVGPASYPAFRTWVGFKNNASYGCDEHWGQIANPSAYCKAVVGAATSAGRFIRDAMWGSTEMLFSCNGYTVAGIAGGSWADWKLGVATIRRGYVVGGATFITCQTKSLWDSFTGWW